MVAHQEVGSSRSQKQTLHCLWSYGTVARRAFISPVVPLLSWKAWPGILRELTRLPLSIRRFAGRALQSIPLRIRGGPNAGMQWSLISSGRGYSSGKFESDRIAALLALTRAGDRIWDIGAHQGYVSLAFSRAVGPTGEVLAFEPSPSNRELLERHVRWNDAKVVRIFPWALSDSDGRQSFGGDGSSITFRLGRGKEIVETRTIDSLITKDHHAIPDVLKIDTEGAEAAILRGGLEHLSPQMLIWISVHSRALYDECRALLEKRGFTVHESARLAKRTSGRVASWGGDSEMLAVGSGRKLTSAELHALRLFSPEG